MNNTLVKGLAMLEALARSGQALGVTELAARLGIPKSNVHRMLQALVALRYVLRDEASGSYRASIRLWELGSAVLAHFDLREAAGPRMEALLESTRETVHLSILDRDEVVYVHKLDSPEPVRAYSQIGGRVPAHCVATGKAMLAFQGEAFLAALSQRLERHSPRTLTDGAEFLREMKRVRSSGIAVNRGEWRERVWGVAAPIRGEGGRVVAAVGLSGPAERFRPARLKELAVEVAAVAEGISLALHDGDEPDPVYALLSSMRRPPPRTSSATQERGLTARSASR